MTDKEEKLIRGFAEQQNVSVSQFIKNAALERIEDELDARAAEKAYAEYLADPVTYSMDEVREMLGITQEEAPAEIENK